MPQKNEGQESVAVLNRMIRVDFSEVQIPEQRFTGDKGVSHFDIRGTAMAEGEAPRAETLRQVGMSVVEWVKERMLEDDAREIISRGTGPRRAEVGHGIVLTKRHEAL